jgi:hypothetical protein
LPFDRAGAHCQLERNQCKQVDGLAPKHSSPQNQFYDTAIHAARLLVSIPYLQYHRHIVRPQATPATPMTQ